MEIHKPKATHTLREFLTEIGTIVCGILIALVLEQAAEAFHRSHLIEQAEDAMRSEIMNDDGPQAYARLAITPCLSRQVDALRTAVEKRVAPDEFGKLVAAYNPPKRSWDDDALKAAQSSGALSNMGAAKIDRWTLAYLMMPSLDSAETAQTDALRRLNRTRFKSGDWSQSRADELSDIVDDLGLANERMARFVAQQSFNMKTTKLELPVAVRQSLLAEARTSYGDCAVEPDLRVLDAWQRQLHTAEQDAAVMKHLMGR
jgi:hypothetical protein